MKQMKTKLLTLCVSALMAVNAVVPSVVYAQRMDSPVQASSVEPGNLDMWYNEPTFDNSSPTEGSTNASTNWQRKALPIGNGYMGALIYGGVKQEQLTMNDITLWNGGPGVEGYDYGNWSEEEQPQKSADLKAIQQKINDEITVNTGYVAGKLAPSNQEFLRNYGSYQALGDLDITMSHSDQGYSNYIRGLDLDTAVSKVSYTLDGVTYDREYFFSYPDRVLVARYTASEPGAISMTTTLSGRQSSGFTVTAENATVKLRGALADNGMIYEAQARVLADGGSVTTEGQNVAVSEADSVTVVYTSGTDYKQEYPTYKGEDPAQAVAQRIEDAAGKGYEALKSAHLADYTELYARVKLDIGQQLPSIPTDQLIDSYPSAVESDNRYLEALGFNYGRFLLIQSSRDGSLPANLQGVWNPKVNPAWQSDYHMNINLQMNYWAANVTNLSETERPLIDFMKSQSKAGNATVKSIYQNEEPDAWVMHNPTNIFGYTGLQSYPNGFWYPESSAWLLTNMMEHYNFTQDQDYLQNELYPLMKGNVKFWLGFLTEDPRDPERSLVVNPSCLPEEPPFTAGGSMSQQIVADLFDNFIQVCEEAGQTDEWYTKACEAYEKLDRGLHISEENGMIRAWKYKEGDPASQHRHLNQAYALYPANDISFDSSSELMKAEWTFVDNRGDGAVGWSRAWKMSLWARMQNPERAFKVYQGLLSDLTGHNMFMQHPPFQIDANLGTPAGVAEMLLQSHNGYIEPLLGLPEAWGEGSVKGLKARGDFAIDMEWSDQTLNKMVVTAQSGGNLRIRHAHLDQAIVTKNGEAVVMTPVEGIADLYEIDTQIGDVVSIVKSPEIASAPKSFEINQYEGETFLTASWNPVAGAEKYTVKRIENGVSTVMLETEQTKVEFSDDISPTQYVVTATVNGVESMPTLLRMPQSLKRPAEAATEPVAHWSFDEIDGQTVINSVDGHPELDATAGENISYQQGLSGNAAFFPGINTDYSSSVLAPVGIENINTDSFAVSMWVKLDPRTPKFLVSLLQFDQNVGPGGKGRTPLAVTVDQTFATTLQGGNVSYFGGLNTPNEWQHLVVVSNRNDNSYSLYANGELVKQLNNYAITHDGVAVDLRIGQHRNHLQSFIGMIDEVKYFDSFITADTVKALYQEMSGVTVSQLNELIADAEALLQNGLVPEQVSAYQQLKQKITAAKEVADSDSPTQQSLKTAFDELNTAMDAYRNAKFLFYSVPEVNLTLDGNPAENVDFRFALEASEGTPMPAESELVITGAGNAGFGSILFEQAGEYTYTITQKPGTEPGYVYDLSTYTLTVTVRELDGSLQAESVLTQNGDTLDEIRFINSYTQPVAADKTILKKVLDYASQAMNGEEYAGAIESVKTSFDAAYQTACNILENAAATQQEVDTAWISLMNEIHKLGFQAGDKTQLNLLIATAQEVDLTKYITAGQAEFLNALDKAIVCSNDGDALQTDVETASEALLNAMMNLRFKADKSVLKTVLDEAMKINTELYTAQTVESFLAAAAEAQAAYNNPDATQEEVNEVVNRLWTTMNQLKKIEVVPINGDQMQTSDGRNAKTGETVPLVGIISLTLLAGAGCILLKKKK